MRGFAFLCACLSALIIPTVGSAEVVCSLDSEECVGGPLVMPNGYIIPGSCALQRQTFICVDDAAEDQCTTIVASPNCSVIANTCIVTDGSNCLQDRFTYSCFNEDADMAPAQMTDTVIERVEDFLVNSCGDDVPAGCTAQQTYCTGEPEIRTIRNLPISRDCWEYRRDYFCPDGSQVNECTEYENDPSCSEFTTTCLSEDKNSNCVHWDVGFRCGGGEVEIPESCTSVNVCVSGICEPIEDEPDTGFAQAAAWLGVLDEMADDSEGNATTQEIRIFTGTGRKCSDVALGIINCCKGSGWGEGWLEQCSESELALRDSRAAGSAHYVGSYCAEDIFGICLKKNRSYCTYNSKLARVFQEEIHRIDALSWGTAQNPECGALTVSEIETLDWDQIDLSEAFDDALGDADVPSAQLVETFLEQRLDLLTGGGN